MRWTGVYLFKIGIFYCALVQTLRKDDVDISQRNLRWVVKMLLLLWRVYCKPI